MGVGYLADRNEVADSACTITSNVDWAETAPLTSLRTMPLIDAAESLALGTAAEPVQIDFVWDAPIFLTYGGLHDTNLRQASYYRFEAWGDEARTDLLFTTTAADGRDRRVVPGLTDPRYMRAGAPNQMRGDLEPRDFRLYPTHLHVVVPLCRPIAVRWTLWGGAYRADDSNDTGYRLGLAWAGDGVSLQHVVGSGEGVKSNDDKLVTPGGGVWVEPGVSRRNAQLSMPAVGKPVRDTLFDMSKRAGQNKPLVWLPNVDRPEECFRYGGLFRRADDHEHKYVSSEYVGCTITLEEWKE